MSARETHGLVQGTDAWLGFRAVHFGASEAAAMLGISPKMTRDELMRLKHLGLGKEFSAYVQEKVLNEGHRLEAMARPHAEAIVGEELYPVTMSMGKLSASCDGLTMLDDTAFEHKSYNAPMAELMRQGTVPPEHMPQCQQVLYVTGAERLLFMLSNGSPERMLHVWVYPDVVMQQQLITGWAQFEADLACYVLPAASAPAAVGRAPEMLPSVLVELRGEVVSSNLLAVKAQAVAVFKRINRELHTDQDFADAATTVKWCDDIETRLKAAKAHALGQAKSIEEVFMAFDEIIKASATSRLALTKLVDRRRDERKGEIVAAGVLALREHVHGLNEELGRNLMPAVASDFATAVKNRRSFESMTEAVNAEAARVKVAATEIADRIKVNLASLTGDAHDWEFLFPDLASVCHKPAEDFANLLGARIAKHHAAEQARKAADDLAKSLADAKIRADLLIEQQERDTVNLVNVDTSLLTITQWTPAEQQAIAAQGHPALVFNKIQAAPEFFVVDAEVPHRTENTKAPELPTLKLGDICARLGLTVTAAQLEALGFIPAAGERGAKLFRESEFVRICDALIAHIQRAKTRTLADATV